MNINLFHADVQARKAAIEQFMKDLSLCCDMGDRKNSVKFLADKVGAQLANEVARQNGLKSAYYMA